MLILNTAVKHKLLETISEENNIVYLYKHSPDYTFVVKTNKRKKLFSYEHTQKTDTIIVDKDVVATALPHALPADMREIHKALLTKWTKQEEILKHEAALANMTAVDKRAIAFLDKYCKTK